MKNGNIVTTHAEYGPIQGIDINNLKLGYYYTFYEDLTLYKKYPTYSSVYFGNHNLLSWINKDYAALCTVVATSHKICVYSCRNPNSVNP